MRSLNLLASITACLLLVDVASYSISGAVFGESALYTLSSRLEGFNFNTVKLHLLFGAWLFVMCLVLAFNFDKLPCVRHMSGHQLTFLYITFVLLALSTGVSRHVVNVLANDQKNQTGFYENYIVPARLEEFLHEKRNLVYLYLESVEAAFFDESVFPGLLPNLKELGAHASNYTEVHDVGDFTMGAFVASQCGLRLITPIGAENMMDKVGKYLPRAVCLGDWLNGAGYNVEYIGGAAKEFAGKNIFLTSHGFLSVKGSKESLRRGEAKASWGRFDDATLDDLFLRYEELAATGRPFSLFSLTVDTHAPGGSRSPRCGDLLYGDGTNPMLNSVHCSDRIVSEFIRKVRAAPKFGNTVLVVGSDHPAHLNTADPQLSTFTSRKLSLLIFDGKDEHRGTIVNKPGSTLDIGATILSYLSNGKLVALGLGRSLQDKESITLLNLKQNSIGMLRKQLDGWRTSFTRFWSFPDSIHNGFCLKSGGILEIDGSHFSVPVAFELDQRADSKILSIVIPDDAQTELMQSTDKPALFVNRCARIFPSSVGEYCYLHRTYNDTNGGPMMPDDPIYILTI